MRFLFWFTAALAAFAIACSGGSKPSDASPTTTEAASQPEATASLTVMPSATTVVPSPEPSATSLPTATPPDPTATSAPVATQPPAPQNPSPTTVPASPSGTAAPIRDYTFPSNQTVPVGSTVVWTNYDTVPHDVTAKDGSWSSGLLGEGKSFSHTFTQPGKYPYACRVHPYMVAVLTVQ